MSYPLAWIQIDKWVKDNQLNFNLMTNTDGSFTMAVSNSFSSP